MESPRVARAVLSSSSRSAPVVEKKTISLVPFKGDIPASLSHYFQKKNTYPVYIPEGNIFAKLFTGYMRYENTRLYVMGVCDSETGTIQKVTREDWERLREYKLEYDGPYVRYGGFELESAIVPTFEEYEEASVDSHPLSSLVESLQNLPKNRVLAKHQKELAIILANSKLKLLGSISREQQLYIDRWVPDDYCPEFNEEEKEEKEESNEEVNVPKIISNYMLDRITLNPLDPEFEALIKKDLAVKEVKQIKSVSDQIRDVVVRTPQPMIKPPVCISQDEEIAWLSLDPNTKKQILENLSFSPFHAHLVLTDVLTPEKHRVYNYQYSKALTTLGKMMFYCLKRLRFGELCQEKSLGHAAESEDLTKELKKRWQPVSNEERKDLLNIISRMIFRTTNFYISEKKTIAFLDQFLPFWNIPGVNFTGSICCFLTIVKDKYKNVSKFYTPTRFEIRLSDITPSKSTYFDRQFKIYPLVLYFPMEGTSQYFTQKLKVNVQEGTKIQKYIKNVEVLKPSGEIDCPMACVVIQSNYDYSIVLVRVLPNTDCDVPVFEHDQLDNIALQVYTRVKRNGTILERQERGNSSHCWNISMSNKIPEEYVGNSKLCTQYIKAYMNFFNIQIYRTREEHIWTHHVAMTRVYGKCVDGKPEFSVSPDQLNSNIITRSERYNYFAGKTTPLSILHKYMWRGYSAPHYIEKKFDLTKEYIQENLPIPIGLVTTKMSNWCNGDC